MRDISHARDNLAFVAQESADPPATGSGDLCGPEIERFLAPMRGALNQNADTTEYASSEAGFHWCGAFVYYCCLGAGFTFHVTGHDIALGEGHLAAEFRPNADTTAETISSAPSTLTGINERLVGEVDRGSDRPVLNRTVGSIVPPAGVTPTAYWATLRGAVGVFNSGTALDYDLGAGRLPGRLGDGYNSNGFLVGIVRATGGQIRGSLSGFVEANRPVPSSSFGR